MEFRIVVETRRWTLVSGDSIINEQGSNAIILIDISGVQFP